MKKISILTIHFGVNHGSALQAFALYYFIKKIGCKCVVINYIPKRYALWNVVTKGKKGKYPLFIILGYFILSMPKKIKQRRIFSKFLSKNVELTKKISDSKELESTTKWTDMYIVGSDQVWNYDYNEKKDYSYFLDFAKKDQRKIAYAASIGKDNISDNEKEIFKKYLENFFAISVREDKAKDILESIGVQATHVLDPTFLLTKFEWKQFFTHRLRYSEKYLVVYVMDFLYQQLLDIAEKVAKEINCKIYVVSFKKIRDYRADKEFINLNPFEFLELLYYSEFVVTNSFHGTAFSINFNKQFIALGKNNYNSRIKSLVKMFALEKRYIEMDEIFSRDIIRNKIDYTQVNLKLEIERKKSICFIENGIKV